MIWKYYITKTWTFQGYFFALIWLWFLMPFLAAATTREWVALIVAAAVILLYMGIAVGVNKNRLRHRELKLQAFVKKHHLRRATRIEGNRFVGALGAIDEMHNARDCKVSSLIVGDDWEYGDFSYKIYGQTRGGDYHRATVYYGVMSTRLPRILPNVFFDSIKARGRQFRFHFAGDQRHSLEGDFDKFFVTYFPNGYTIDSMSFISPDVMWVMRDAADYDIEIVGDRLFLYGPLYDPEKQIPDMAAKIAPIKKELLDNILTYRDERLPFAEGRRRVTATAMSLKLSKFWTVVGIVVLVAYLILRLVLESQK